MQPLAVLKVHNKSMQLPRYWYILYLEVLRLVTFLFALTHPEGLYVLKKTIDSCFFI